MRRQLFNLAAALSLLLFVAVCVLWVRSYWAADLVRLRISGRNGRGFLSLTASSVSARTHIASTWTSVETAPAGHFLFSRLPLNAFSWPRYSLPQRLGFSFARGMYPPTSESYTYLWLPHWAIATIISLPAALWLLANRRAARRLKRRGFAVEQASTTGAPQLF